MRFLDAVGVQWRGDGVKTIFRPMPASHTALRSLLDSCFHGPAWHGPSVTATLRGIDPAHTRWRPAPGRNTIWDLVLHLAYWKHRVRRRITGEHDRFPRPGADFPAPPRRASATAWRADVDLLEASHARLVATLDDLSERALDRPARANRQTPRAMLVGCATHDLYHGGQIMLIRRMAEARRR